MANFSARVKFGIDISHLINFFKFMHFLTSLKKVFWTFNTNLRHVWTHNIFVLIVIFVLCFFRKTDRFLPRPCFFLFGIHFRRSQSYLTVRAASTAQKRVVAKLLSNIYWCQFIIVLFEIIRRRLEPLLFTAVKSFDILILMFFIRNIYI